MKGRFVDEENQAKKGPSSFALYFLEILLLRLTILFFFFFVGAYLELGILPFWSRMPQTRKHLGHTSVAFIQGSGTLSPFPPSPNVHILNCNTNGLFVFLTKVQEQSI